MDGGSNESKKAIGLICCRTGGRSRRRFPLRPIQHPRKAGYSIFRPGEEHTRKEDESISLNFQPFWASGDLDIAWMHR